MSDLATQPDQPDPGHVMPEPTWAAVQQARREYLASIGEPEDDDGAQPEVVTEPEEPGQ